MNRPPKAYTLIDAADGSVWRCYPIYGGPAAWGFQPVKIGRVRRRWEWQLEIWVGRLRRLLG